MSDEKTVHQFKGKQLTASWDGRLCIHNQECTRATGELFVSGRQPWGEPDRGEPDHVAEVIRRCPTGALAYKRHDQGTEESPERANTVVVANNGPLYLRGDLKIDGAAPDMPGVRFRAALCRCGWSKHKPFCDNTHEVQGFRDTGAVGETGGGFERPGGPLEVKSAPDGPLLVTGNFEIVNGSGRAAWRGTKAALCRCGSSKNKPFCDGSHKTIRFKSD